MTDRSEFLVNHDALQLNMKILGDFKGYSLYEFCDETQRFIIASETWDLKPYSLTLADIDEILIARQKLLSSSFFNIDPIHHISSKACRLN